MAIYKDLFLFELIMLVYTHLSGHFDYKNIKSEPSRVWYNGSTKASQALDEGSIPFARTKNRTDLVPVIFLDCGDGREPDKRVRL